MCVITLRICSILIIAQRHIRTHAIDWRCMAWNGAQLIIPIFPFWFWKTLRTKRTESDRNEFAGKAAGTRVSDTACSRISPCSRFGYGVCFTSFIIKFHWVAVFSSSTSILPHCSPTQSLARGSHTRLLILITTMQTNTIHLFVIILFVTCVRTCANIFASSIR